MRQRKYFGDKNQVGRTISRLRKAKGLRQSDLLIQLQVRGIDLLQLKRGRR